MSSEQKILGKTVQWEGKWLRAEKVTYIAADGQERAWEGVSRTGVGTAVGIVTIIPKSEQVEEMGIVLIQQWRPLLGKYVLEMPAGLVDEGEIPALAGIRELMEETGFDDVKAIKCYGESTSSSGLTDETRSTLVAMVKGMPGEQNLDETESIEVHMVSLAYLNKFIEVNENRGILIDSSVRSLAIGMKLQQLVEAKPEGEAQTAEKMKEIFTNGN